MLRRSHVWIASVVVLAACSNDPTPSDGPQGADEPGPVLVMTFDDEVSGDGGRAYPASQDTSVVGRVQTANGATVEAVEGPAGRGTAVQFPAACAAATGCPRALIEVADAPELDPGGSDFTYGAAVLLQRDQTAKGSNVVQKGRFGGDGGQWKLQVDTLDGKPSCVVRDGRTVVTVRSPESVSDGQWHDVTCSKEAAALTIAVDGRPTRESATLGAVENDSPVRVGSPGLGDADDQFHGAVDDVFLRIDA
jgi:hypothetical protein